LEARIMIQRPKRIHVLCHLVKYKIVVDKARIMAKWTLTFNFWIFLSDYTQLYIITYTWYRELVYHYGNCFTYSQPITIVVSKTTNYHK
jgi:hypothetical protein